MTSCSELQIIIRPTRRKRLHNRMQQCQGCCICFKKYFDKVVVKVDKDGCIGIDGNDYFFCPSLEQFKNVDSTGAGDAFLAGFIYGLFYDYPLKDCIEFGNITGGKAVTAVGALSAYVNEKSF